VSLLFGFATGALIMPAEFAGLAGIITGSQTLAFGIVTILAALALALVAGRTFCAHVCPVGSIQELAYTLPVPKIVIRRPRVIEGIRLAVFCAAIFAALYGIDLAGMTGAYEFFTLTLSAGLVVFAVLVILSVTLYRPVCRGICPFGFLFALAAQFSRYRLVRTEACTGCRKCEKACPAQVAGRDDPKRECYLCARCTAACPVKGALVYGRQT
jgi:polyferredoxin